MLRSGASGGYTIVETMIFLAVTSLLFVAAMTAIGGKQASVQFAQATRDAQSQIQKVINEVSTGYYPSGGSFTCTVGPTALDIPTFSAVASLQGSSNDCVFLGKAVQLGTDDVDKETYNVINMAARRLNVSGKESSSLKEALPTAIPGITESFRLQFGLSVTRIVKSGSPTQYGTIIFLSTLPKFQGNTGTLASGTQRVSYGAVPSSLLDDDLTTAAAKASNLTDVGDLSGRAQIDMTPSSGIIICLADNPNPANATRKAYITVGQGASQTSATLTYITPGDVTECP